MQVAFKGRQIEAQLGQSEFKQICSFTHRPRSERIEMSGLATGGWSWRGRAEAGLVVVVVVAVVVVVVLLIKKSFSFVM